MACVEQKPWGHSGGVPYFIFTQKKCGCEHGCFQINTQGFFFLSFVCVQIFNIPDLHPYVRTPTFTCFSRSPVSLQCCQMNSDNCSGFLIELLCDNNTGYWLICAYNVRLLYNIQMILFQLVNKTQLPRPEALCAGVSLPLFNSHSGLPSFSRTYVFFLVFPWLLPTPCKPHWYCRWTFGPLP